MVETRARNKLEDTANMSTQEKRNKQVSATMVLFTTILKEEYSSLAILCLAEDLSNTSFSRKKRHVKYWMGDPPE